MTREGKAGLATAIIGFSLLGAFFTYAMSHVPPKPAQTISSGYQSDSEQTPAARLAKVQFQWRSTQTMESEPV